MRDTMSDAIPHIPALRLGRTYESLEKIEVKDHRTGEVKALVSTVNGGIVRRDPVPYTHPTLPTILRVSHFAVAPTYRQ